MPEFVFYVLTTIPIVMLAVYAFVLAVVLSTIHVGDGPIDKDIESNLLVCHFTGPAQAIFTFAGNEIIILGKARNHYTVIKFHPIYFGLSLRVLNIKLFVNPESTLLEPMQVISLLKKESYMRRRSRFAILYYIGFYHGNPFWGRA